MSVLRREQLLELSKQFKSIKNIFPDRLNQQTTLLSKGRDDELGPKSSENDIQVEAPGTQRALLAAGQQHYSRKDSKDLKKDSFRKLVIPAHIPKEDNEDGKLSDRSQRLKEVKKFNYTKSSLNCIPLTNRARYHLIQFVHWKHFQNIILALVFFNSIILGIVDYRYQGNPSSSSAPIGNQILSITEPIYAVIFTSEALIKIVAMGFAMSKNTYLRDPWNALDFTVVITSLLSFLPNVKGVSILRAFRLFKPLRNLQQFPSMRLLIRTLVRAADRIQYLIIFFFFVMMIFAIIGVNLMQGITNQRCRMTQYPVNGDWLINPNDPITCYQNSQCSVACGSLYDTEFNLPNGTTSIFVLNQNISVSRDSKTQDLMFGYAAFDNLYISLMTLFEIAMLQDWYKILYMMINAYNPLISGMFFVVYILMTNYFLQILTVGIIMQKFIELNEHTERQEIFSKIMGQGPNGKPINIEELKNKYNADQQRLQEDRRIQKIRQRKAGIMYQIKRFGHKIMNLEVMPLPETPYHQQRLPQLCWRIHQNSIYETSLTVLGLLNALALSFIKYPDNPKNGKNILEENINYLSAIVAVIFLLDQIIKLIGQGIVLYINDYENALYSITSVGSIVHIAIKQGQASPITAFTLLKLFKIIRRSNLYQLFDQLTDSIVYTLSVMMSYCAIIVLFVYIFSLLGMQFFAGKMYFNSQGVNDLENGQLPRLNFDTLLWSLVTVLTVLLGNDWSYVMFNCMMATAWYACFYFILLILIGQLVLMNLFLAILIGNFEEASLIVRDAKFLKSIQHAKQKKTLTLKYAANKVLTEAALITDQVEDISPHINDQMENQSPHIFSRRQSTLLQLPSAGGLNLNGQDMNKLSESSQSVSQKVNQAKIGLPLQQNFVSTEDRKQRDTEGSMMEYDEVVQQKSLNIKFAYQTNEAIKKENDEDIFTSSQANIDKESKSQSLEKKPKTMMTSTLRQLNNIRHEVLDEDLEKIKDTQSDKKVVSTLRLHPYKHHFKQSSLGIFSRNNIFRQFLYNLLIDPEHIFPDKAFQIVDIDNQDEYIKTKLLEHGYNRTSFIIQRRSYFYSVEWEVIEEYSSVNRHSTTESIFRYQRYIKLHKIFNYSMSLIIFINVILLLLTSPINDPQASSTKVIKRLDIACTVIFIIEAVSKIIALGLYKTSIIGCKPYIKQFWNIIDIIIIMLSLIDLSNNYPRYDGLLNSFKCIRVVYILSHFKTSDLLQIIFQTIYRSLRPIFVTLMFTCTFLFIYGLIGINFLRGRFPNCQKASTQSSLDMSQVFNLYDCNNLGGDWFSPTRNFDNIFSAMLTLFEMMSGEDWLTVFFMGVDANEIGDQPKENSNQAMIIYFIPFMIVGHIFIWHMFGGVMIENFNRARDKFYDYALMTSEQRNWVEMQRSLIEKRLKVKVDDYNWAINEIAQKIVQNSKFDYFILSCILANTILQAVAFYNNPKIMDSIQITAGYVFAAVFNIECILKLLALGKYYFWVSHNIFDFALIIGTNVGILMSVAFPSLSIGSLATLLRAFRIGRVLNLLKQKKSLKMLIDTIFYILPILIKIIGFMFMIILIYAVIGIQMFSKVMYQSEINVNASFNSLGAALLLLFRCTTGQNWNLLMREFALTTHFQGQVCMPYQSYGSYIADGPLECGSNFSYPYFLSFVIVMQLMIVNLFIAIVLEGFAQFSIQNNAIVGSQDYETLIDLWSDYDPTATGWIKPEHLAFLIYQLPAPLGKGEDYKEILLKTLDHKTIIKQYSDKKAINMKTKFIYNEEKGLILPHSTVLKLLLELELPVYSVDDGSVCHFKDVCLKVTIKAMQKHIENKKEISEQQKQQELQFDKTPEEQQKRLDDGWNQKYQSLAKSRKIENFNTGMLWAGFYILKMIRMVNNGFGRSQFKKKMAQNRLFMKLRQRHHMIKVENIQDNNGRIDGILKDVVGFQTPGDALNKDLTRQQQIDIENRAEKFVDSSNQGTTPESSQVPQKFDQQQSMLSKDGGPQNRGRSPSIVKKNKDHLRSTWWRPQVNEEDENEFGQSNQRQPR